MAPAVVLRTAAMDPRRAEPILKYEREQLATVGAELRIVQCDTPDEVLAAGRDAAAIIHPGYMEIPRRIIEQLENCKIIVVTKVGFDNIDVDACSERGIVVANLPDGWTNEVADVAMGLLLDCNRHISIANSKLKTGDWQASSDAIPVMPALRYSTLGILGLGRIGKAVAKRALGFGLTVIAYDPLIESDVFARAGVEQVEFDELCQRSDFISLHPPLTAVTYHIINERALRMMKPHAVIINTSRGPVIDEPALIMALQEGMIGGAGLDVFEKEPCDPHNPLLSMDNVVVLPHKSGFSRATPEEHRVKPIGEVVRVLSGRPPRPEAFVNRELWARGTVGKKASLGHSAQAQSV
jgi:D-3-phosphoglycerate dehydrogenase / 2-oxoglutarate reductase